MRILVGADPEVFVQKGNNFESAHNLIPGTKESPFPVDKGAVQVDGMALEFNINPAESDDEFVTNITTVFNILKSMVPEYNVIATPVADFSDEIIKSQPAAALELGCDPDYNAWTGGVNIKPNANRPMRTASGHVHIGWVDNADKNDASHVADCCEVVKQMDFYLGLASLMADSDTRRREMYGKAGCCRFKSYGVEYRTLSNFWLNSEKMMRWVFNNVQIAMKEMMNGNILHQRYGDIQEIINTSNVKEAKAIINAENILVPVGV